VSEPSKGDLHTEPVIRVEDLSVHYRVVEGEARSVDHVSLTAYAHEILGIVGESGCGKSTLVEGLLRLVKPPGHIPNGRVVVHGTNLLALADEQLRRLRWRDISYIPQGSMNALNPVIRVEEQMRDAVLAHQDTPPQVIGDMARAALRKVGLPAEVLRMYAHQLSGGMRQRAIIAMALLLEPTVVVADEPVTALDVVAQKAVLQTLARLRDEFGLTIIFVSHDLAAHAEIADRVAIMYAGKVVEVGSVDDIFNDPLHPYTRLLIDSVQSIGRDGVHGIPGLAPNAMAWPSGCRFHPRCPVAVAACPVTDPDLLQVGDGRSAACHLVSADDR
jgi:peptide/nickel transport system ATP-binding protein